MGIPISDYHAMQARLDKVRKPGESATDHRNRLSGPVELKLYPRLLDDISDGEVADRFRISGAVQLKADTTNAAPGIRVVIFGQVHGGKNNICITRSGHRFPNKKWAAWRNEAVRGVIEQLPSGFQTITDPVSVRVTYVAGDRRRRDCPAILDAVWHVLEKAGVVADDTLLWPVESSRTFDKDSPRCEIEFLK